MTAVGDVERPTTEAEEATKTRPDTCRVAWETVVWFLPDSVPFCILFGWKSTAVAIPQLGKKQGPRSP